jgi:hypothetical protein
LKSLGVRAAAGAATVVLSMLGAAGAQAQTPAENPFHCEASALRVTIAGQQAPEPAIAGRTAACGPAQATPAIDVPGLLDAQALFATTNYDAVAGAGTASGGLTQLSANPAADALEQLPLDQLPALPTQQALAALPAMSIGLPQALADELKPLGIPASLQIDVRNAAAQLVPAANPELLGADVLSSKATVSCAGGRLGLSGSSQVTGVRVAGQELPLSGPVEQALTLIGAQTLDPAKLDPNQIQILTPLTGASDDLRRQIQAAIGPALAQLPPIQLPASVADVKLVPREQLREGNALTQRALHATVTIGGQQVLDAVVGEARVSAAGDSCPGVAAQSVSDQILACSDRKLVLVDVLRRGNRVKLLGAANRRYVGRRVAIRLRSTGRVVAHATVRKDGSFETTAPRPPLAQMASHTKANSLRYRAEIGRERSLPLKLQRRMIVSSLRSAKGKVTIRGRVVRPLTTPRSTIRLVRRVSCHKVVLVKRFKPRPDGTFTVTVKAPKRQAAAVYRMTTYVREKPSNPKKYPTFTLPRGVALNTR